MMKPIKSFTLIELLIVIVIISILAVALVPRLKGVQAKARDTQRIVDLKQIQTALEMYANDNNGNYPSTLSGTTWLGVWGRKGACSGYGSFTTSGLSGYIPGLAPDYISRLPIDPKQRSNGSCYLYKSNGVDYSILAWTAVEGVVPAEFIRPIGPNDNTFAIYTPGARMR